MDSKYGHEKQGKSQTEGQESIVITKCLNPECTGFYTDSLSGSILVRCLDPVHDTSGGRSRLTKTSKTKDLPPFVRAYDLLYQKENESATGTGVQSKKPETDNITGEIYDSRE